MIWLILVTDGNRWHFEMPGIMEGSILIMSKAGTGTAMFNMGKFITLFYVQIPIYVNITYPYWDIWLYTQLTKENLIIYAGIFMALQEKFIVCGASLTALGMVLKFIAGPAAMAIGSIAVGLHGDVLRVAIIQVAILNFLVFSLRWSDQV